MKKKLFIGTTNKSKINEWKRYLPDLEIITPDDLDLRVKILENKDSLIENSQKKAKQWASASHMLTLSEDTGFYMNGLNGMPGVSVKTWGGEFKKSLEAKEWIRVLKTKISNLNCTCCFFEQIISLATPTGQVRSISHRTYGKIEPKLLDNPVSKSFPLASVFVVNGFGTKCWQKMTDSELKKVDKEMINKVRTLISS